MLEFLRKYQYGLMFVVAVVVIIAFAFLYDRNSYGSQRVTKAFQIYGEDYTDADVRRGVATFELSQRLGLYDMLQSLYGERQDGSPQEFIYQHIILKKKALEMGLHASQEAIEEKIRSLRPFQFQGKYDQTAFDNFKMSLGSFGYTVKDLYDLVGDAVVLEKLKDLLAASYAPAASEVEDSFLARYQKVSSYKLELKKEDFAKDVAVTDEEIKTYYEENKATLMSDAKRSIEYVHFVSPKFEAPASLDSIPGGLVPPAMLQAPEETGDPLAIPDLGNLDDNKTPSPEDIEATLVPDASETEPAATEPAATEPAATEPAATEPAATEPAATEPAATEPAATEPAATEPAATEPAATEPAATEPAATEPAATEPSTGEAEDIGGCQGSEDVDDAPAPDAPAPDAPAPDAPAPDAPAPDAPAPDAPAPDAPAPDAPAPDAPAPDAPAPDAPAPDAPAPDAPAPDAPAPDAPAPGAPAPAGPTPAERKAANDLFNKAIDDFFVSAVANKGDFSELITKALADAEGQKYKVDSGNTELFAQDAAPEAIAEQAQLIADVFNRPSSQPLSNPPVRVADGFYVYRVTGSEQPEPLTLEQATEQIRETLMAEKTREALEKAGKEMAEKFAAEMKGGAKFTDAAAKLNLTPVEIPTFEGFAVPQESSDLRETLMDTVAGQISEPVVDDEKATLVYVASRTVTEDAEKTAEEKKKTIADQLTDFNYKNVIFTTWLQRARKEANPKPDDLGLGRSPF